MGPLVVLTLHTKNEKFGFLSLNVIELLTKNDLFHSFHSNNNKSVFD